MENLVMLSGTVTSKKVIENVEIAFTFDSAKVNLNQHSMLII